MPRLRSSSLVMAAAAAVLPQMVAKERQELTRDLEKRYGKPQPSAAK